MFAARPDIAAREIVRVTKKGGRIGFATWPPELAVGRVFTASAKSIPHSCPDDPLSPLQWGIPEVVQKGLTGVKDIYFERGTTNVSILSPNHYWIHLSTKFGPLMQVIQQIKNEGEEKVDCLRKDFLKAIEPYVYDNVLKLGYFITVAIKA